MENDIILHGSFSSPFSNWIPWLYKQLKDKGKQVIVPQFPIGVGYQNYENWSGLLRYYKELGYLNRNTTIIAHSIAPIFVIKFLLEHQIQIGKLIFIAGSTRCMELTQSMTK